MKFWTEPEIHVLAQPDCGYQPHAHVGWAQWLHTGDKPLEGPSGTYADSLAEGAGRACYWSYGKGRNTNEEYIRNIVESGHGSVLEHPTWTFGLRGISRSLSHELVRHRHLSFSQLSQRYYKEEGEFVVPPLLAEAEQGEFRASCERAMVAYTHYLEMLPNTKRGREAARAVLPNATATRIVVTGNARSLRNMLALRGSEHADAEFRRLAVKWTRLMKELAPNIFADFKVVEGIGGECVEAEYPRV